MGKKSSEFRKQIFVCKKVKYLISTWESYRTIVLARNIFIIILKIIEYNLSFYFVISPIEDKTFLLHLVDEFGMEKTASKHCFVL